jgi:hypothetical protein
MAELRIADCGLRIAEEQPKYVGRTRTMSGTYPFVLFCVTGIIWFVSIVIIALMEIHG